MGRRRILTGLAIFAVALIAFAWIDGGRQQQRMIEQTVDVPGSAR